jgi:hypothetical protein
MANEYGSGKSQAENLSVKSESSSIIPSWLSMGGRRGFSRGVFQSKKILELLFNYVKREEFNKALIE